MNKFYSVLLAILYVLTPLSVWAQDDDDDNGMLEEVMISGFRATQGGAQDIDFFRGEVEQARIPHPETITAEGLFSQHDILFNADKPCQQLFCLTSEYMPVELIAQPEAKFLVGLGFTSNIDPKEWQRQPVNLVAVVDKSGSMDGSPLNLVRQSLEKIVKLLNEKDQLSIVLYGDRSHTYLAPTRMTPSNKSKIVKSIEKIESAGSTYMESGLKLGYEVAFDSMDKFKGNTRLMLFTDERPNVGKTDAASFIGMAKAASLRKVGLTTIGVGVQFGSDLATKISSIRGGNLFFIQNENSVDTLFDKELDFMVSELAHDLTLTIKANPHYSIAGIYGVPGEMLGWQKDKSVSVVIPTVFLSSKGGAILISLAKNIEDAHLPAIELSIGDTLADISLNYESASSGEKQSDAFAVKVNDLEPSEGMHLAYFLADEFTALHRATTEHYLNNDQESAYQIVNALNSRMAHAELKDIDGERKLVAALFEKFAFLSGHGSESQSEANYVKLWDSWEIYRIRGDMDYEVKDIFVFTPDNKLVVIRKTDDTYDEVNDEEYKSSNKQIYLLDSEITFNYSFSKNKLILKHPKSRMSIRLVRTNFDMNSVQ